VRRAPGVASTLMTRRLGLLGGTFDPPHLGHLGVAECARVELELDELRFLVAGDPWMKSTVSPAADRTAMVRAAIEGAPGFALDDREVDRPGPTYTADTLAELQAEEPDADWWFVLGEDAAWTLPRWERIEEAFALATFVVVTRPGQRTPRREELPGDVVHLEIPQLEVSSTQLRARFGGRHATRYLVPDGVDRYVRARGLYGAADG
jgi:nicotinate-nucleotide adenylyltransferase